MSHASSEETPLFLDIRSEALDRDVAIQLLRTLIIEPNAEAATLLSTMVGGRGHDVACVTQCAEALSILQHTPPDLLLVRLNHASANAVAELLAALSQLPSAQDLYIIALTDDDEPVSRVEAWVKRGFHDFITFHSQQTLSLVRNRLAIAEHSLLRLRASQRASTQESAQGKRYEEVFLTVPEASLIVTARDGYILEANPATETVLGLSHQDLVNRYLSLVLPALFDHEDYDPQVLGLQDTVHMREISYQRPDGKHCWLDVSLTKIPWPQTQAFLLQVRDLTHRKEQEARGRVDARQDAAARIMIGVARELSDSLTTTRGNLELLARIPSTRAESRELISSAIHGCERAEALSHRLTTLGRRQQGLDIRRQLLRLQPLLEKSIPFALLGGNCRPVIQVAEDLWPVEADETALAETMRHLVANAVQAMPQGGTLFVEARNQRTPRQQIPDEAGVQIILRDQGCGIAADNLTRACDPFFSTTGREGMGLANASAIVRAHGGRLILESTLGEGTTVEIWLPVNLKLLLTVPPNSAAPASSEPQNESPVAAASHPEPRPRVLFMDDEAQICVLVQKILTAHGFDVYCTKDGQEAIDVYRKAKAFGAPFDVLLMDLDVRGGMGGQEAVARLHAENPNLKALLTTGYVDDALLESHKEHGFLGVIPKPFQVDRLVGAIAKLAGVKS